MTAPVLVVLALLGAAPAFAHVGLFHPAMYGWQPDIKVGQRGVDPLSDLAFDDWWFHGKDYINNPPAAGVFLELPAGGSFIGQVSCDKASTIYGPEGNATTVPPRACTVNPSEADQSGALHSADKWSTPLRDVKDVKGTALAIVYESDVSKIQPEDFVVISTNQSSPWVRDTEYKIPAGLPACPEAGCTCMWGWIHGTKGGKPNEMYMLGYRCKILNADPKGMALPAPKTANKCPVDKTNCTIGAKQAHFWAQKERNNNMQDNGNDPPYYNSDYGFTDGAQTDLWDTANTPDKPTSVQAPSSSAPVTGGGESLSTLTLTVTSTKTATVTATVTANARDVRRSRMRP